jgi:Flp pilus assembly protein TadD
MACILGALILLLAATTPAPATDDPPLRPPPAAPSAESRYNDGLSLARASDWRGAEQAHLEAIRLKAAFSEAWNGLGHVLRKQNRYDESVRAYREALLAEAIRKAPAPR